MEASQFAPLAGTTKNTVLRFESGQFMPRPHTVHEIDRTFRERGIYPTFTREGEPRGIVIGWQAYRFAYPGFETKHKTVEEIAEWQRQFPPPLEVLARSWKGVNPDAEPAKAGVADDEGQPAVVAEANRQVAERNPGTAVAASADHAVAELPRGARGIDELEAEQQRLMAELLRLKQEVDGLDDEHDF